MVKSRRGNRDGRSRKEEKVSWTMMFWARKRDRRQIRSRVNHHHLLYPLQGMRDW
jgi:hypothetical protein